MMADLPYSRVCDALQNGSRQTLRVGVRGRGGPDSSLSLERAPIGNIVRKNLPASRL
jgi:hypothetical protein